MLGHLGASDLVFWALVLLLPQSTSASPEITLASKVAGIAGDERLDFGSSFRVQAQ
jgi:hypothetical protein